jgi:transcriptional regulator with XRE-family HTH domain
MRLHAYLNRNGIRVDDFAVAIGVSSLSTVYRYLRGERIPNARAMEKIRDITGGAVTADDFFRSREWWQIRRARELAEASQSRSAAWT